VSVKWKIFFRTGGKSIQSYQPNGKKKNNLNLEMDQYSVAQKA